jgi:CRISPR type III-B/RAMP module-associated protein Cmr3
VRPARPVDRSGEVLSSVATGRRLGAPPAEDESDEELFVDAWLLTELLTGADVSERLLSSSTRTRDELFASEPRLGLAIDNHRGTSVPGVLFARPYRRFAGRVDAQGRWSGAGFVAWMDLPGTGGREIDSFDGIGFLGGDRRRAWFSFSGLNGEPLEQIKSAVAARLEGSRGFLVYLLTPLPVNSELPDFPWQGEPVAAAIGRSRQVSGWNAQADAPGPRKIRTLVPAGTTYFFEWTEPSLEARQAFLESHWLQPVDASRRNAGFGRMLIGVWV